MSDTCLLFKYDQLNLMRPDNIFMSDTCFHCKILSTACSRPFCQTFTLMENKSKLLQTKNIVMSNIFVLECYQQNLIVPTLSDTDFKLKYASKQYHCVRHIYALCNVINLTRTYPSCQTPTLNENMLQNNIIVSNTFLQYAM
jgi:hypothetical protein